MIITDYAIQKKTTVFVLMFIFVVTGVYGYLTRPREAAPDIEIPFIMVMTSYRGQSPVDIEKKITVHLENELKGLSNVKKLNSTSADSASMIFIEFDTEIENEEALREVKDRVERAKSKLPPDAEDSVVMEFNLTDIPVMIINLYGNYSDDREKNLLILKAMGDKIKDQLLGVDGVLDAQVVGGLVPEVRIELEPDKLAAYRIPAALLIAKYMGEDVDISGGNTEMGRLKYDIRVPMEFERNIAAARDIVIMNQGPKAVYLADLANIVPGYQDETSLSRYDGKDSVSILVQKQTGKNLLILAKKIQYGLEQARESGALPDELEMEFSNDQSEFVEMVVKDLDNNIATGFVFVLVVLMVVLGFRTSLFVALAIPFSLLIALTCFVLADIKMNMIVLFSLILSLGMLVDNAIVIVENIYRHQQEGYGRVQAAILGSREVAWPVITSTLTTVLAFSPLLFWPGIMGDFMGFLPMTVIICLSSSLFVALIINPTLCAAFLNVKRYKKDDNGDDKIGAFMRFYRGFLRRAIAWRFVVVGISFALLFGIIGLYFNFGAGVEFFPSTDPKNVFVDVRLPEGTNLETTDSYTREIETIIEKIDDADGHEDIKSMVTSVGTQGSGGLNFGSAGTTPYLARIAIEFIDMEDRTQRSTEIMQEIRRSLTDFAGVELKVEQQKEGPPTGPPINVEFYGDDYDLLGIFASKAKKIVEGIPGAVDVRDDLELGRPEISIKPDRNKAQVLGLSSAIIGSTIQTAYLGSEVGNFRIDDEEYDIMVIAPEKYRTGADLLHKLYISTQTGSQVPASSVADWKIVGGPGVIRHVDKKRVVTIKGEIESGYNGPEVREKISDSIENEMGDAFPEGYGFRITGEQEDQEESQAFLSRAFAIAVMLVMLVLISQFNSLELPLIILSSVVLSLFGVFAGLLVLDKPFGIIMTGVGVISLVGVVVNNSIVLIDYIQKLRQRGLTVGNALVQAGMTRLRPVLLTAATTILGLSPMVLQRSFDVHEMKFSGSSEMTQWWSSMAVAVVFGLAFATLLTLVVVPTLYFIFYRARFFVRRFLKRGGLSESNFGRFVAANQMLKSSEVEEAENRAEKTGLPAHEMLAHDDYLGREKYLSMLSDFTGLCLWDDLSRVEPAPEFGSAVPRYKAEKMGLAGFYSECRATCFGPMESAGRKNLYLATSNPLDEDFREQVRELKNTLPGKVRVVLAEEKKLSELREKAYAPSSDEDE